VSGGSLPGCPLPFTNQESNGRYGMGCLHNYLFAFFLKKVRVIIF
jgi:hypothetical protein